MRAIVDKETCIGCGLCTSTCEEVFEMNDDNIAVAIKDEIPEEVEDTAIEARDGCPVDAISIES